VYYAAISKAHHHVKNTSCCLPFVKQNSRNNYGSVGATSFWKKDGYTWEFQGFERFDASEVQINRCEGAESETPNVQRFYHWISSRPGPSVRYQTHRVVRHVHRSVNAQNRVSSATKTISTWYIFDRRRYSFLIQVPSFASFFAPYVYRRPSCYHKRWEIYRYNSRRRAGGTASVRSRYWSRSSTNQRSMF
jgi:hypothetical protein